MDALPGDLSDAVLQWLDLGALGALGHASPGWRRRVVGARRAWAAARPADLCAAFLAAPLPAAKRLWHAYGADALWDAARCGCDPWTAAATRCVRGVCPNDPARDADADAVRRLVAGAPVLSDRAVRRDALLRVLCARGALAKLLWLRAASADESRADWPPLLWIACARRDRAHAERIVHECGGKDSLTQEPVRGWWLVSALSLALGEPKNLKRPFARWFIRTFAPTDTELELAWRRPGRWEAV